MTNEQIIQDIATTIYGEDAVMTMIENGQDIPLHTVKGWEACGPFQVKRGEHGLETRLWKKQTKKKTDSEKEESDDIKMSKKGFYMAKAYLFRGDQVQLINNEEKER